MKMTDVRLIAHHANTRTLLTDTCGYVLVDYTGTGVPETERLRQIAAGQRGFTDIGFGISARLMELGWQVQGSDNGDLFGLKELLNGIFSPQLTGGYVRLDFITPSPFRYSIDVYLNGSVVASGADRIDGSNSRAAVQVVAPDLRFYNAVQKTASYNPSQFVRSGWHIPWEIDWILSNQSSITQGSFTINYVTDRRNGAPEYPTIRIIGPVSNPGLLNTTTGQTIRLDGYSLLAGQAITIDLKNGQYGSDTPTIRNDSGVSLEQFLSDDSDVNFHLAPLGEYLPITGTYSTGQNVLTSLGTGTTSSTNYAVIYKERYFGF